MSKRKTSKDYRKEYRDTILKLSTLERRIKERAIELCNANPDVEVTKLSTSAKIVVLVEDGKFFDTDFYLNIIKKMEKYHASLHPHKQVKMDFHSTPNPSNSDTLLQEIDFTEEERNLLCSIINRFSDGQHPVADDKTIKYFTLEYITKLFPLTTKEELSFEGRITFLSIEKKLATLN